MQHLTHETNTAHYGTAEATLAAAGAASALCIALFALLFVM